MEIQGNSIENPIAQGIIGSDIQIRLELTAVMDDVEHSVGVTGDGRAKSVLGRHVVIALLTG